MLFDVNKFVEDTVERNEWIDFDFQAERSDRLNSYMKEFGISDYSDDEEMDLALEKTEKSKEKVRDQSWTEKKQADKTWQAKEGNATKSKPEQAKSEKAHSKKENDKSGQLKALKNSEKDLTTKLGATGNKTKENVSLKSQKENIPKSKEAVITAKKTQQQQGAFYSNFAALVGVKSNGLDIKSLLSKNRGKDVHR